MSDSTDTTNSTPPEAPSRCPSWLFVLETDTSFACELKTVLMAVVSALSPKGVLVPWALI